MITPQQFAHMVDGLFIYKGERPTACRLPVRQFRSLLSHFPVQQDVWSFETFGVQCVAMPLPGNKALVFVWTDGSEVLVPRADGLAGYIDHDGIQRCFVE